jgi:hypothetical protein
MKRIPILWLAICLCCMVAVGCHRKVTISKERARIFGDKALARYCTMDNLPPQSFQLSKFGPEVDLQWALVYISSGLNPAHRVTVTIDEYGNVETSSNTTP